MSATGNYSRDAGEIAGEILDGLAKFVESQKPKYMQLVRITVFQKHMVNPFHDEMNKRVNSNKNKGFWSKFVTGTYYKHSGLNFESLHYQSEENM